MSGIVAIFGEDLVDCEIEGLRSSCATRGHRFHHPGEITIGSAADYRDKLRACHVLVDHAEREALIRERAKAAAAEAGLSLVEDEGLVVENAGLTEWPVPLLGRFDEAFLEVPPEVIQLTARTNQKYFVCEQDGKLANAFVCTANIVASDGGEAIVAGNRKVLAARLSDARFFWEQDRKKTLAQHAEGLARITFHEKLGTVADKVERVAKLARWLVEEGIVRPPRDGEGDRAKRGGGVPPKAPRPDAKPLHHPADGPPPRPGEVLALANLAEQAARLCKADLVTEMVGEFPELQGLMGGYYARAEGLPDAVADAIRDHYKPVGQGDEVPTAPVTVAVSLADKLDTLVGFFFEELPPTGSKDPFALRRAALAVISLIQLNGISVGLNYALSVALWLVSFEDIDVEAINKRIARLNAINPENESRWGMEAILNEFASMSAEAKANADKARRFAAAQESLLDFFADRLKVQQREAGVRHDLIDAVFALGGEDDLVRLLARVNALQAFVATQDGANLLAGYKRAANILKKEEFESGAANPAPEPAEHALIAALDVAAPKAAAAVEAEDFAGAMAALASLRAPIDAFFDAVTVNDADAQKRAARLSLLSRFRDAVHSVADFSKIEG